MSLYDWAQLPQATETHQKYQQSVVNANEVKVSAPDLHKPEQLAFLEVLLKSNNYAFGYRNRDIRVKLSKGWKTAKIAYERL